MTPQRGNRAFKAKRTGGSLCSPLVMVLICMSFLVFFGVFLTITFAPEESGNGPSTNSILTTISNNIGMEKRSISDKIREWMPQLEKENSILADEPDWGQQFWTPIDVVDVSSEPIVIMCKLNFKMHATEPHSTPMFKDFVSASECVGSNRRREQLKNLIKEIDGNPDAPENRILKPNGFVFHESRVGSTLIANMMASDPYAMVFSESAPMANALLHCESCSFERKVQLFKDIGRLMGRSPVHKHLFFKFQSITSTMMDVALEAFPDVPWAFVFRHPVQTMMSHLDPKKNSAVNAPCLRSKRNTPQEVKDTLATLESSLGTPNEAWCAAHLNMLCEKALQNYEKYSIFTDSTTAGSRLNQQRGLLINYDSLPGYAAHVMLPHFGIDPVPARWLQKMESESDYYSKGRGSLSKTVFKGDSADKDTRATEKINKFADEILTPSYELLNKKAIEGMQHSSPKVFTKLFPSGNVEWSVMSEISSSSGVETIAASVGSGSGSSLRGATTATAGDQQQRDGSRLLGRGKLVKQDGDLGHSSVLRQKEFVAWAPFTNHHSSKPIEVANCPMKPEADYPKAFSMLDVVNNWNPDNTDIPPLHYDSLCHFDFQNETQQQQAFNYRKEARPFVVYNHPEVDAVVEKWNDIEYLSKRLGSKKYRTETSLSNHFMYWRQATSKFLKTDAGKDWQEPTQIISERFEEWLEVAVKGQNKTADSRKHEYFRVSSDQGNPWVFDELPFFKPKKSIFIVDPHQQRGIHCRFGMRSVIAEPHFDGSRNAVVMLGGMRRWILTHPDQCKNMHMLMPGHPSARHSAVDWSNPDLNRFPNFAKLKGNEVILRPGDYLFVPTNWIHYIISLNVNFQCNTRSGIYSGYDKYISECGF